ncbi:MAG TPA: protein-glutamate O-methyltransferase [Syntrophorhabdaceae bacterium]|jgi:chemotaxis protein methyltransferase CheR
MTSRDFSRLARFIHGECGIKVTDAKKPMLEARLQKRLRKLGLNSFSRYCDYLFSPRGMEEELSFMINEVSTNKTDFFREPNHFHILVESVLPSLMSTRGSGTRKRLTVWSAGCSSGEEPYTLAMVLKDFAERLEGSGFAFLILATDISTSVLKKAEDAVYNEERVAPIPYEMKRKYLLRSRDKSKQEYRVAPELRSLVRFRRLNFMDNNFGFREQVDIIFCRNVIIYFDKPTQEKLLTQFCRILSPGGFIFMGHSETLFGMDVPLVSVAPTVYKKI